jgi:hypothetical protein
MAHDDRTHTGMEGSGEQFDAPNTWGQRDPQQPADRVPEGGTDDGGGDAGQGDRTGHPFHGGGMGDLYDSVRGEEEK